jgi:hypothetical protein
MKFGKAKARARACARALAKGRRVRGSPLRLPHTMSLEFKFWVAHIIGLGNSLPPPRVCRPLPRVTLHGMESCETWIIDLRDRMPIVDDRPREHAGQIGKIDDAAAKAEVAAMRAAFMERIRSDVT